MWTRVVGQMKNISSSSPSESVPTCVQLKVRSVKLIKGSSQGRWRFRAVLCKIFGIWNSNTGRPRVADISHPISVKWGPKKLPKWWGNMAWPKKMTMAKTSTCRHMAPNQRSFLPPQTFGKEKLKGCCHHGTRKQMKKADYLICHKKTCPGGCFKHHTPKNIARGPREVLKMLFTRNPKTSAREMVRGKGCWKCCSQWNPKTSAREMVREKGCWKCCSHETPKHPREMVREGDVESICSHESPKHPREMVTGCWKCCTRVKRGSRRALPGGTATLHPPQSLVCWSGFANYHDLGALCTLHCCSVLVNYGG